MLDLQRKVAEYLQSNTALGSIGINLFLGQLPSSPVSAICIRVSGGPVTQNRPKIIRNPQVQILSRADKYSTAAAIAEGVFNALHTSWNVSATQLGRMTADHEVGPYYRDQNNNYVFTNNFQLFTVASTL